MLNSPASGFFVGVPPLARKPAQGRAFHCNLFAPRTSHIAKRISVAIPHAELVSLTMDVHEPKVRSYNMSRIKGKNTKPEMLVRKFLFSKGFRYRLHVKNLPGKPDIVLPKYKTVIFVHGCFWHGHEGCKYYVVPKTRTEWWLNKIDTNKRNDAKSIALLNKENWKTILLWECDLKSDRIDTTLAKLILRLSANLQS